MEKVLKWIVNHKYIVWLTILFSGMVLTLPPLNDEEGLTEEELAQSLPSMGFFLGFPILLGLRLGESFYRLSDYQILLAAERITSDYKQRYKLEKKVYENIQKTE